MEGAHLAFSDTMSVYMWGGDAIGARRVDVTVPRSLRRYFGRTVQAIPSCKGLRDKRPRRPNRRSPPVTDADFGE